VRKQPHRAVYLQRVSGLLCCFAMLDGLRSHVCVQSCATGYVSWMYELSTPSEVICLDVVVSSPNIQTGAASRTRVNTCKPSSKGVSCNAIYYPLKRATRAIRERRRDRFREGNSG
jgi:hypothetical protein